MSDAKRQIIFYGDDFWDFYHKQDQKVKKKINWTLGVIKDLEMIPEKYFKHIVGTDLYEVRVSSGNNIFRIFCFFDKGKLFYLEYNFRLLLFLLTHRFDVVCAIDLDTAIPVIISARLSSKPWVFDAHEYFSEMEEIVTYLGNFVYECF